MYLLFIIISFALANRIRGSKIYGYGDDTEGRMIAALIIMTVVTCHVATSAIQAAEIGAPLIVLNLLAMSFGWDNYWSAAIGNPTDRTKPVFWPVDVIMKRLMFLGLRAWGTVAMGLRSSLYSLGIVVTALVLHRPERAIFALGTLLCGIPYLAWGYVDNGTAVPRAEYTNGAWLGFLYWMVIL